MHDIFSEEQKILDDAVLYSQSRQNGDAVEKTRFDKLVKEYGRLLKQLRRTIKLSDRTTVNLNASKLDLLDKVHYDALTGIYSRRFMEENLERIIKSLTRSGEMLSVMMIDVDHFKNFNDTYGHNEGDTCLRSVAETIARVLSRADDFVARFGGEEFAVILPHTNEEGAHFIAKKILRNIVALNIPHDKSETAGYVTISIGVTTGHAARVKDREDFIRQADKALYRSKQNGRNCYTFVDLKEED